MFFFCNSEIITFFRDLLTLYCSIRSSIRSLIVASFSCSFRVCCLWDLLRIDDLDHFLIIRLLNDDVSLSLHERLLTRWVRDCWNCWHLSLFQHSLYCCNLIVDFILLLLFCLARESTSLRRRCHDFSLFLFDRHCNKDSW